MDAAYPAAVSVMRSLVLACHPGPTVAVTALTAALAVSAGHDLGSGAVVMAAVFFGQLSIGWSNDVIDASRDRVVGRSDKPVAVGSVGLDVVRRATGAALVLCVAFSLLCGLPSAAVHLLLGVASGWAYNLWLKRTAWSFLPYAVAFGCLPAVVSLARPLLDWPPLWMVVVGSLLGVGAHLLNALPDLLDDVATGVVGLPHRLGATRSRVLAAVVLVLASLVAVLAPGSGTAVAPWMWVVLVGCVVLAGAALRGRGRVPFVAAIGVAALDVVVLVLR